jgi:two-component system response regulator SaeR
MKNILVVDDNKALLETLASYLRSKLTTYQVLTAEDGEQAIEQLKTKPISLILTDLAMPKVDGYKVITYAQELNPPVPVIIMTSAWSLELEALIEKMKINRYIEKPFQLEDFDRIILEPLLKSEILTDTPAPD